MAKEDVALIVDAQVSQADVEKALREGAGPLLESVSLFDVYTGEQVGEGKKSLAFALRFRGDKTLTDSDATELLYLSEGVISGQSHGLPLRAKFVLDRLSHSSCVFKRARPSATRSSHDFTSRRMSFSFLAELQRRFEGSSASSSQNVHSTPPHGSQSSLVSQIATFVEKFNTALPTDEFRRA